jgi:hypothetical protein
MRRIAIAVLLAVAAAALTTSPAWAKEANVELSSTPAGISPGDPWNPTIAVFLANERPSFRPGAAPTLTIVDLSSKATTDFKAMPTDEPGRYTVDVVFPHAGLWSYKVFDPASGRTYPFPTVDIPVVPVLPQPAAPEAAPAPVADGGSFPLWPVLGGALAALALVVLISRSARLRPSAPARR